MRGMSGVRPAAGTRPGGRRIVAEIGRQHHEALEQVLDRRARHAQAQSRRRRNGRSASAALTARRCATPRRNRPCRPQAGRHSRYRRAYLTCRGRAYRPQRCPRRARPAPATARGWCRRWSRTSRGSQSPRVRSACRPRHNAGKPSHVPSRAWKRSIAGRVERSTVARAREIDCSSGTGCSGVASRASNTSATTPTPPRTHFRRLREPRIRDFSIVLTSSRNEIQRTLYHRVNEFHKTRVGGGG